MFCRTARRRIPDAIEGTLAPGRRLALEHHLASCAACASIRNDAVTVSSLLADLPAEALPESVRRSSFEETVVRRARIAGEASDPIIAWRPSFHAFPITAAAVLLLLAGVLAMSLSGMSGSRPDTETRAANADPVPEDHPYVDRIAPREIPFTFEADLVGIRRGRIPATTYVLEPAPEQDTVVRASF